MNDDYSSALTFFFFGRVESSFTLAPNKKTQMHIQKQKQSQSHPMPYCAELKHVTRSEPFISTWNALK